MNNLTLQKIRTEYNIRRRRALVSNEPCSKGRRREWRWRQADIHRLTLWWWGAVGSRSAWSSARSQRPQCCPQHVDVTVPRQPANHRDQSDDLAMSQVTCVSLLLSLLATYLQRQHQRHCHKLSAYTINLTICQKSKCRQSRQTLEHWLHSWLLIDNDFKSSAQLIRHWWSYSCCERLLSWHGASHHAAAAAAALERYLGPRSTSDTEDGVAPPFLSIYVFVQHISPRHVPRGCAQQC